MRRRCRHAHRNHRMVVGAEHAAGHRRLRKGESGHPRGVEEHQRIRQTQQRHPGRLRHPRRGAARILRIAPIRREQPAGADHQAGEVLRRFLHARHMVVGAAQRPDIRPSDGFRPHGVFLQQGRVRTGRHRRVEDPHMGRLLRSRQKTQENRRVHHRRFGGRQFLRRDDLAGRRASVLRLQRRQERGHQPHQ